MTSRRTIPASIKAAVAERQAGYPFDVREARRLYREGNSIRQTAALMATNRESIRRMLNEAGLIRGRLDYHGPLKGRLLSKIDIPEDGGCWIWKGTKNNKGYGIASVNGKHVVAHRAVYQLLIGDCPAGTDACHKCDNPLCVNPQHIFFGNRRDNMQDASRKNRTKKGEQTQNAILTEQIIRTAHRLAKKGIPIRRTAVQFNVPYKALHAAVTGKTWKHLQLRPPK